MIHPTADELSGGQFNRYELVIAASKGARIVTDEYVRQREIAERLTANKETDKSLASLIGREYRDERAVKTAIRRIQSGEYVIKKPPEDIED